MNDLALSNLDRIINEREQIEREGEFVRAYSQCFKMDDHLSQCVCVFLITFSGLFLCSGETLEAAKGTKKRKDRNG